MKKILALCEGRHEMPVEVEGAIFGNELNPLDIEGMERTALDVVIECDELVLYVTGLSVALVSVINACHKRGVVLSLMHYDRNTDTYYCQKVY